VPIKGRMDEENMIGIHTEYNFSQLLRIKLYHLLENDNYVK
jgi:hypothetical protein